MSDATHTPPELTRVDGDAVHVWSFDLDAPVAPGALSPGEAARAARLIFEKHRRRFATGRVRLREILGAYLGEAPERLAFVEGPQGKPALAGADGLEFNLSHSGALGLLAVTRGAAVGVDLEQVRERGQPLLDIAERFFAPQESQALRALPEPQQRDAFYRCWTRKEAFIKGLGVGLSVPLAGFRVSLDAERAQLVAVDWAPELAGAWSMAPLRLPEGYVGALARRGPIGALQVRPWAP